MKTLNTQKKGAGHYRIYISEYYQEIGYFDTTDGEIFDDINEMNRDGFEQNLTYFESFNEIIEFCFNQININTKN